MDLYGYNSLESLILRLGLVLTSRRREELETNAEVQFSETKRFLLRYLVRDSANTPAKELGASDAAEVLAKMMELEEEDTDHILKADIWIHTHLASKVLELDVTALMSNDAALASPSRPESRKSVALVPGADVELHSGGKSDTIHQIVSVEAFTDAQRQIEVLKDENKAVLERLAELERTMMKAGKADSRREEMFNGKLRVLFKPTERRKSIY